MVQYYDDDGTLYVASLASMPQDHATTLEATQAREVVRGDCLALSSACVVLQGDDYRDRRT